jgi:3-methyladenine DNA glycosylase AlkD
MNRILKELRTDLLSISDEKTRLAGERYFREDVKIYGIKSSEVGIVSKEYYKKIADKSKKNVFALCEDLWKSGMMEESFIACNWSYNVRKEFTRDDFVIFEDWVNKYINNWASCDTFCNHTVGAFIDMYPEFLEELKKWANSKNRWVKRASAVSLIIPGKKGRYLKDIFQIADILHADKDDMVQKGYGWMLKVASQAHQQEVFEYVLSKKSTMPRTALRYAIEKMPADLKAEAMKK